MRMLKQQHVRAEGRSFEISVYVREVGERCYVGEYRELPRGVPVTVRKLKAKAPESLARLGDLAVLVNKLLHDCVQAVAKKHGRVRLV